MGSGNKPIAKLDVSTDKLLIECKYTDAERYILKKQDWQKVQKEANKIGKTGIMEIDINGIIMYIVPQHVLEVFNEGAK